MLHLLAEKLRQFKQAFGEITDEFTFQKLFREWNKVDFPKPIFGNRFGNLKFQLISENKQWSFQVRLPSQL